MSRRLAAVFDLDRTATALAALDADIIGLQEVDVHWGERSEWRDLITELGDRLDMHPVFAPIYSLDPIERGQPRREYGVALLSRFPVLRSWNHDLTRLSELWTAVDDAWLVADSTGVNALTYPAVDPQSRIDYITVSASDTLRILSAVVPEKPEVIAASDHRPVVADLRLTWRHR